MWTDQNLLLAGRYRLLSRVGTGAFAEVWRARDERLGRDVAVKLLSSPAARDPLFRAVIERETSALASLAHPAIVVIHDAGTIDTNDDVASVPFIVMEHVDGPDLARELARRGPLPPDEAVTIVRAVLAGVGHAHKAGIVHGDLKPANILLAPSGAKVVDFGVARLLGRETGLTVPMATPAYASPEVLRGERPTPASDVYAAARCLRAALGDAPPARLAEVLDRALAAAPERRYASASELDLALAHAVGVAPRPPAVAVEPTVVLPARPRRLPSIRRVPFGIVVAAAAIAAIAWSRNSERALVRVPDLRGRDVAAATTTAGARGFAVRPLVVDGPGRAGIVLSQNPSPGGLKPSGSTISLRVAKGAPQVVVPDVSGKTVGDAGKALTTAKLSAADVSYVAGARDAAGTVIRTVPPAGTTVDEGTPVQIIAVQLAVSARDTEAGRGRKRGRGGDD